MRDTDLFQVALGLSSPWTVTRSEFDAEDGRLDSWTFRVEAGSPAHSADARAAPFTTRRTRHGGIWIFSSIARCCARARPEWPVRTAGVRKVATPWARAGSGFTLLFEAYGLALAKAMPIANAARRLGEHDTRLWRIVAHYVWRAVEALDL